MAGSALEQLVAQLRGVLESLDTATVAVGVARDGFGEARDVVVEATYGTEDPELIEEIGASLMPYPIWIGKSAASALFAPRSSGILLRSVSTVRRWRSNVLPSSAKRRW